MLFIFDMGGVVTTSFDADCLFNKIGISGKDFYKLCSDGPLDIYAELSKGTISTKDFWDKFNKRAEKLSVNKVQTDLFRMFFHPELNQKTVKLIKALSKKNRVVCGTNTIQSHWENHLERGDYSFFDQTYASNKIGKIKPDVDFFKIILEAENCKPEDAFFTDDKIENVEAAKKTGINAVLFESADKLNNIWKKYI